MSDSWSEWFPPNGASDGRGRHAAPDLTAFDVAHPEAASRAELTLTWEGRANASPPQDGAVRVNKHDAKTSGRSSQSLLRRSGRKGWSATAVVDAASAQVERKESARRLSTAQLKQGAIVLAVLVVAGAAAAVVGTATRTHSRAVKGRSMLERQTGDKAVAPVTSPKPAGLVVPGPVPAQVETTTTTAPVTGATSATASGTSPAETNVSGSGTPQGATPATTPPPPSTALPPPQVYTYTFHTAQGITIDGNTGVKAMLTAHPGDTVKIHIDKAGRPDSALPPGVNVVSQGVLTRISGDGTDYMLRVAQKGGAVISVVDSPDSTKLAEIIVAVL